jgi:hypothetical protein
MEISTKQSVFNEVSDFLASKLSVEDLAAYQIPPDVQARVDELLDKNREEGLSIDERIEIEKVLAVTYLMSLVSAKVRVRAKDD